jgi:hypothetical protein
VDFDEPEPVERLTKRMHRFCGKREPFAHRGMSKCNGRMVEPEGQRLLRLRPVQFERRRFDGRREHRHRRVVQFELRLGDDTPANFEHRLRQQLDRFLQHHLCETRAVAQHEKRHVGQPALPVQPTLKQNLFAGMRGELG